MCGLVGIMSSNMMMRHKDALSDMLYLDTWRGKDSTGVAAIRHNADTAVMKSTIPGYEFVEGKKLEDFLRLNDFLWIGHNRYGTVGKNIKTNAHPFMIDDEQGGCVVVGAHNGTLKNKHVLIDHNRFGTDSEALYNNIAIEGLEKTIEKTEGAWALTYYDHINEEFRILRNKERPLFYAWSEDKKTLIWASEIWMIKIACSRRDIKLLDDKVITFNEDTLYSIPAPMKMNEELVMHRKGGVAGKQPTAFFQGHQTWRRPDQRVGTGGTSGPASSNNSTGTTAQPETAQAAQTSAILNPLNSSTQSGTKTSNSGETPIQVNGPSSNGQSGNVVPLEPKTFRGYAGRLISKVDLLDQLDGGCAWCEKEHIAITDKRYGWLAPGKPVCAKCMTGKHQDEKVLEEIFESLPVEKRLSKLN